VQKESVRLVTTRRDGDNDSDITGSNRERGRKVERKKEEKRSAPNSVHKRIKAFSKTD
jgi:hypothetical protein